MYVPDSGYSFAYLDYSQAEARIVATKGGVARLLEEFARPGGDIHSLTASLVLGVDQDEIEEYPHRYLGKRCNHAFNYEMGPYKFWTILARDADETGIHITRSQATKLRDAHFRAYPELRNYWDIIRDQIRSSRTIENPFGRVRRFLGRLDDDTFREGFSHYAQSTVADLVRSGMYQVHSKLVTPWRAGHPLTRIVLEVHDALLLQFPIGAQDEFIPKAIELMTIPFEVDNTTVTIPVDAKYGSSWEGEDWKAYAA